MTRFVLKASPTETVAAVHSFHVHADAPDERCLGVTVAGESYGDGGPDIDLCIPMHELSAVREEAAMP